MFAWFRRLFGVSANNERQRLLPVLDALNVEAGGGQPTVKERILGTVESRSRTLVLGDPQFMPTPSLEIPRIPAKEVEVTAKVWRYPNGMETAIALKLTLSDRSGRTRWKKIGAVGIDSAKIVIADKVDIEKHWNQLGMDRVGVISTAPDDKVLRLLAHRFELKTVKVNPVRAEVVGPVSETTEKEIIDYLKSNPKYADYPFLYFHVQTNNSFERANFMKGPWDFMPIGNASTPLMFVCGTGRGDGLYDVMCQFSGNVPCALLIPFVEDAEK